MNKKRILTIISFLIMIISIFIITFYDGNKSYSYVTDNDSLISVKVYNKSSGDYAEQSSIPTGNYTLNEELSYCEGEGIITGYNNVTGRVTTAIEGADKCFYYFDRLPDLLSAQITEKSGQVSSQDSTTWAIVNEGNGLRYEGKNPDNYVCFTSGCSDSEKYRIIGLFTEMVDTTGNGAADTNKQVIKVIKNTSIGTKPYASGNVNNWNNASLKTYLNDTWTKPTTLAITTRYYVKGYGHAAVNAATFLNYERNGNKISSNPNYVDTKIGVMYPSDYAFGVLASSCSRSTNLSAYNASGCYNQSWLHLGSHEWSITPDSNYNYYGFYIDAAGYVSNYNITNSYAIRPVFYMDASIAELDSGTGSKNSPFLVSQSAIISFKIDGTTYHALNGMTWSEWIDNSTYNTDGYGHSCGPSGSIYDPGHTKVVQVGSYNLYETAFIQANMEYTLVTNKDEPCTPSTPDPGIVDPVK